MEHDIDKMSNVSATVVLLVSFNVNSFDYLSVKGNLNPVAKGCTIRNVKGGVGLSGKACYFFHNQQECRIFFSTFKPLHDFFFPK